MRVVDLDRDMRDVIPTSTSPDSDYLFEQMTRRTLDPGRDIDAPRTHAGDGRFDVGDAESTGEHDLCDGRELLRLTPIGRAPRPTARAFEEQARRQGALERLQPR